MTRVLVCRLLVALAVLVAGTAWALSSPVGSSPDDDYHLASIWCPAPLSSSGCQTATDATGKLGVRVPGMIAHPACYATKSAVSATCQTPIEAEQSVLTTRVDQGDYPPVFYRTLHLLASDHVVRSVLLMRVVNLVLALALLAAATWAAAPAVRSSVGYAVAAAAVPLSTFLVPSVNPTSWAITGLAVFAVALLGLPSAPSRGRQITLAALALIGATMAAGARGDAGVFVVVTAAAAVIAGGWRSWRSGIHLVVLGVALLVGAWSVWSARQVGGVLGSADPAVALTTATVVSSMFLELPGLLLGTTGFGRGLGWMDTPMPATTVLGVAVVLAAVFFHGLGTMDRRKALAVTIVLATMTGIPVLVMLRQGLTVGNSIQPRYIQPLLAPLLLVALARAPRLGRIPSLLIAGALTLANSAALWVNLTRYTQGLRLITDPVPAETWWWAAGPGPVAVWALGSIAFAVAVGFLLGPATEPEPQDPQQQHAPQQQPPQPLPQPRHGSRELAAEPSASRHGQRVSQPARRASSAGRPR